MIKPGEIQQKARAVGVRDQQIEKAKIYYTLIFQRNSLKDCLNIRADGKVL